MCLCAKLSTKLDLLYVETYAQEGDMLGIPYFCTQSYQNNWKLGAE